MAPSSPRAGTDDLVCSLDDASTDADGDAVTYTVTWAKDGVPHTVVGDLMAYCTGDPYKVLLIDEAGDFDEFKTRFRAVAKTPCTLVHSEPTYLEVLPAGVCKGSALPAVEKHTGIPAARIAAFGDGLNDLELLEASGCGVAMGNALDPVKECADRVIGDCDSDAIERFLRDH